MSSSTPEVPSKDALERVAAWLRTNGVVDSATFAQLNKGVEHHRQAEYRQKYEELLVQVFANANPELIYSYLEFHEKKNIRIGLSAVLDNQLENGWVALTDNQKELLGDVIITALDRGHPRSDAIREHLAPLIETAGVKL